MAKLIDQQSAQSLLPNINFSDIPPSALGVESTRIIYVPLKNTFLTQGPWEFVIGQNSKSFLNLKRCWLNVKFKITLTDGSGAPPPANLQYAPCQQFAASLINSIHLKIGDVSVYDSTVNHAYKTYIENTLMYSHDVKSGRLGVMGYFPEESIDSPNSHGFKTRHNVVNSGDVCEMATPISIDLFNQERLFINYAKVELIAYPNKDAFLIDCYGWKPSSPELGTPVPGLKLEIEDVHLLVQEFDLNSGLCMAIEKKLATDRIHYPMTAVRMRSFYIESGRMDSPNNILFTSHTPKRVVVGLVTAEAYNGRMEKSPFNFKPFNLKNIYITLNNRVIPTRPYNLDWRSSYATAYVDMLEGLGIAHSDTSNGITMEMFRNGYAFFVFDISPTVHSPDLFDVIRQGNVALRLEFGQRTPHDGIYVIVYAEYDSILSIDQNRTPYLDTSL